MYRVHFDGQTLHDPRMDGERLTACTVDAEDGSFPTLSMGVPPDHPLHDRLVAMSPSHEVTVEHDGTEVFRGRLLKLPEDMSGTITVGAEGQLAYLRDTRVAPYGTYADTSDKPAWTITAPATAREYVEWLIAQHNAKDGSKAFRLGACPLGMDAIRRSSTQTPTTWQELTDKVLTPFALHARARYEDGTRWLDLLSDDMCHDSGQSVTPSTNLIDMSTTEDWSGVVTAIHATGTADPSATGSTAPTLDGMADGPVSGHDGVSLAGGYVVSESGLAAHGWVEDWRTYDATTAAGLLDEAAADVATAHEVLASIEVSAVDLSLVDGSVPRLALLDYVRVTCPARGIDQSMLCTKESVDVCDPSQSRWTLGALLPTLSRGLRDAQAKVRLQTEQTVTDVASISQEARDAAAAAITSVAEQYYLSTSPDELVGGSWSDDPPTWTSGDWIWSRSAITYGSGDKTTTPAVCVTGATGGGVESVDVMYYLSSSSTDLLDGEWVTAYHGYEDGRWLWTKTVTTYTDGTQTVSGAACVTGSPGQDAITVEMLSTNGTTLRNDEGSTGYVVTVWHGAAEIGDASALRTEFGPAARLLWWERGITDPGFAPIGPSDPRLSDDGFGLEVTAADVTTSKTYRCSVDF